MHLHIASGIAAAAVLLGTAATAADAPPGRGQYLTAAAGCISCHTEDHDGAPAFAGGRALVTPFGTFYSPNITPDAETGIGRWTDDQFLTALWQGRSPAGRHYFPAFPYTSYTGMSREDALAIKAYLFSLQPISRKNRAHEAKWYVRSDLGMGAWKRMYFTPGRFVPDPERDETWNRGAYLVRHVSHCGECHTPRGRLGGLQRDRELAGNPKGPEDRKVPNITPDETDGIGDWSQSDLESFLENGMLPDGDFAGSGMSEVIDKVTSQLTPEDRHAIATYLKALPPRRRD